LLKQLTHDGWKITSEYSKLMFDKGVDFDSYILIKGDLELEFTWTNWDEWSVKGGSVSLGIISRILD